MISHKLQSQRTRISPNSPPNNQRRSFSLIQALGPSTPNRANQSIIHAMQDQPCRRNNSVFTRTFVTRKSRTNIQQPYRITQSPYHYRIKTEESQNLGVSGNHISAERPKSFHLRRDFLQTLVQKRSILQSKIQVLQREMQIDGELFKLSFHSDPHVVRKNASPKRHQSIETHKFNIRHNLSQPQQDLFADALLISKLKNILQKRATTPEHLKRVAIKKKVPLERKESEVEGWLLQEM